ncbi:hypothetical protein O9993_03570 [Vibrio lentus]|nr:hypothetical protein [Vibrio lentus]
MKQKQYSPMSVAERLNGYLRSRKRLFGRRRELHKVARLKERVIAYARAKTQSCSDTINANGDYNDER